MDARITKSLTWLEKEIKKDNLEIEQHKEAMINELRAINKKDMFKNVIVENKKEPFLKKLLIVFGYGKRIRRNK